MVETFKEYFFGAHKLSPFLVVMILVVELIYKQWIWFIGTLLFFPMFYLFLYHCYKKSMLKYEEDNAQLKN